jgi:hypothetical protein
MGVAYDGTWTGMCRGLGRVGGTLTVDITEEGDVSGAFEGSDSGTFDGTVDAFGAITATGAGNVAGPATFDGQIDMMGDIAGVWDAPSFACSGTWVASPS